jgi:hypothetical protein
MRRPALKLVPTIAEAEANKSAVRHDALGTAVWVGEPSALDDLSALTLVVEPSPARAIDGDPYNRPASSFGAQTTPRLKASSLKRRR